MKKYLIILLLLTWIIFQNQLFSYSWELVWDIKCSEINKDIRYPNLSPSITTKIDLIWDKINKKYESKSNSYKEQIYDIYAKVLNTYIQKTKYSEIQKEVLLRIWDYFVCKKEWLKNYKNLDIYNIKISNITDHWVKVMWEWNPNAKTWLYVKVNKTTWKKNNWNNNIFEYTNLGSGYEFTLFVQWVWSNVIKKIDFKTLAKNTIPVNWNDNEWNNNDKNIELRSYDSIPEDPTPTGNIYYFAEDGNDTTGIVNDKSHPFKTLDKVDDIIPNLKPGDAILFAMWDRFKYNSGDWASTHRVNGTANKPIIFSRYWKDNDKWNTTLPILDGSVTKRLNFTETSVGSGNWKSEKIEWHKGRMLKDGKEQIRVETNEEYDDNPEAQFYWGSRDQIIYKSKQNPGINSKWTYSNQQHIFDFEYSNYFIFNGLQMQWTYMWGSELKLSNVHHFTVQKCDLARYSHSSIWIFGDRQNPEGIVIQYNNFDTNYRLNHYFDYISSSDGFWLHNIINLGGVTRWALVAYNTFRDFGHVALGYPKTFKLDKNWKKLPKSEWPVWWENDKFIHNHFINNYSAYARPMGWHWVYKNLEVAYNTFDGWTTQNQIGGVKTHWHHNIFKNWRASNKTNALWNGHKINGNLSSCIYDYQENSLIEDVTIENNVFYNNEFAGIKYYNSSGIHKIRNNIFMDCWKALTDAPGASIIFVKWWNGDPKKHDEEIKNNLFFNSKLGSSFKAIATGNYDNGLKDKFSVEEFNLNSTYDWTISGNIEANPQFIDTKKFKTKINSPVINKGIKPKAEKDFEGNIIRPPYNIWLYND